MHEGEEFQKLSTEPRTFYGITNMTDAIEVALISDNNDQFNSVAVWDIRNGTTLMQYRGKPGFLVDSF